MGWLVLANIFSALMALFSVRKLSKQEKDLEILILRWKAMGTGNRYLAKFVSTLRNWWSEILLYFGERITNGFVEGINRAIRVIINRAYGYRNFDNFRLQVLVQHGPSVPNPTISR